MCVKKFHKLSVVESGLGILGKINLFQERLKVQNDYIIYLYFKEIILIL